ncbi:hypothetical protein [Pseudoalteromonas sp. SMS1]|nr:hypothetical protein [Pseudoalteromonas sp. SMS1]
MRRLDRVVRYIPFVNNTSEGEALSILGPDSQYVSYACLVDGF